MKSTMLFRRFAAGVLVGCLSQACTTQPNDYASGAGSGGLGGTAGAAGVSGLAGVGEAGAGGAGAGGAGAGAAGASGATGGGSGGAGAGGAGGVAGGAGAGGAGTSGAGAGGAGAGGAGAGGAGAGGAGAGAPAFSAVFQIIDAKCGGGTFGCHIEGSPGGLQMPDAATAYDNLVGVPSQECNGETRVVAGDADASLIVKAVEGTACVDRMPDGRDPLTAPEIATLRAWIDGGALE